MRPEGAALTRPLDGIRILVVDDYQDACEMLAMMLALVGANVAAASSVAEAMGKFERAGFDVILSDVHMPEEDGFALMRRLRAERGEAVPVLALTADSDPGLRRALADAGFRGRLLKPVDAAELVFAVRELVGGA